jgi:Na+-translocating ferredoxin:NAD+ oxidoreductase RnfG subunit
MSYRHSAILGGTSLLAFAMQTPVVVAAEYLSIESAQRSAFAQADHFEEVNLSIAADQQQAILALAGPQPQHGKVRAWRATNGGQLLGYFFVDEVVGRQDLITYALGIDVNGKLSDVEILTYREGHGGEIKNRAWRHQFAGRDDLAQLRFAIDIKNIAGATLSCEHVTQGVRWLRALWQITLQGK